MKVYFDDKISKGFLSLFSAKVTITIASALLGIFLPIFLYNIFNDNFRDVVIYCGVGHFLYGALVSVGAFFK